MTDLEQAYDDGLLEQAGSTRTWTAVVQRRLHAIGFNVDEIEPYEFAVSRSTRKGRCTAPRAERSTSASCIDAQTAYEYELMSEETYRELIEQLEATTPGCRLGAAQHGRITTCSCR